MKTKELRNLTDAICESVLSQAEMTRITHASIYEFTRELKSTKKLWRKGGTSVLVKVGLAFIAFPDPTISDVLGAGLVAAGLIRMKIKNSALHVEDVYKTFPKVIKELSSLKQSLG